VNTLDRRERLRRAAEDGERLYRVRMHDPNGPTIADDNRIDGILTLDLTDALGFVDALLNEIAALKEGHWSQTSGPEWRETEAGYGNY
jgi:hypothetical protein